MKDAGKDAAERRNLYDAINLTIMKKVLYLLTPVCLLFVLNGCGHHYYVPNTMVIPAIQKQHDAVISVAACDFGGTEFQAVYSPLKYTALMYNHMNIPRATLDSENEWMRGRLQEGGLGAYYGNFPWSFHLLGGYGEGFTENAYGFAFGSTNDFIKSRLDFEQWFVQPGFVLQTRGLRFGMAYRQVWLHYYRGSTDVGNVEQEELNAVRGIELGTPFSFGEFGLTLGFRIRPFTFTYNSVNIFDNNSYFRDLHFAATNHSFMVTFDLYELWRWKDTPPPKQKNRGAD